MAEGRSNAAIAEALSVVAGRRREAHPADLREARPARPTTTPRTAGCSAVLRFLAAAREADADLRAQVVHLAQQRQRLRVRDQRALAQPGAQAAADLGDLVAVALADHRLLAEHLDRLAGLDDPAAAALDVRREDGLASGGGSRRSRSGPGRWRSRHAARSTTSSRRSSSPARRRGSGPRSRRRGRCRGRTGRRSRSAARPRRAAGARWSAGRCPCPAAPRRRARGRASGRRGRRRPGSRARRAGAAGGRTRRRPAACAARRTTGWQAVHIASMRNRSCSPASRDHLLGVGGVERERLLAEHVLAGLEAEPGVVEVEGVRRRDVDDVDVRVGDQLLVGAVRRARAPCSLARRPGALSSRRRADGREPGAGHQREVAGEGLGDLAGGRGCPSDVVCVRLP